MPFSKRENKFDGELNTAYALKIKEDLEDFNQNNDSKSQAGGAESVIGSGMSQIESVTTFDGGSTFIQRLTQAKLHQKKNNMNLLATNLTDIKELTDSINQLDKSVFSEDDLHVYKTYNFDNSHVYDNRLKITEHRQYILDLIDSYPVCIIQGKSLVI